MVGDAGALANPGRDGFFHTKKSKAVALPDALAPLADTHGHLTSFWEADPAVAIERAALAGVALLVVPIDPSEEGADPAAIRADLDRWCAEAEGLLARDADAGLVPAPFDSTMARGLRLPGSLSTVVGVHPYGAGRIDGAWGALEALAADPRTVGIGEIGLDYTCDVPHDVQADAFRRQLVLAGELGFPVELHLRDAKDDPECLAHRDALAIVDEVAIPTQVELHCYTGDEATLAPWLERGAMVAFGGALTFKNSEAIREAARSCPLEAMVVETDCPYMAPVPLRGLEGEPAMVALTAAFLADLLEKAGRASRQEVYERLWANSLRLFSLG